MAPIQRGPVGLEQRFFCSRPVMAALALSA